MSADEPLLNALGELAREQARDATLLEQRIRQGTGVAEQGTLPLSAAELEKLRTRLLEQPRAANVVALRTWRNLLLIPLCAAAAALLWLWQPNAETLALPEYRLEVASALAQLRSGDAPIQAAGAPVVVHDTLRLVLRPATSVRGAVMARASLQQRAQSVPWLATLEQSSQGAIQMQLQRADTAIRGPATLTVSVSRQGGATQSWQLPVQLVP